MNFIDSIKAFWRGYANFKGRTSRAGFWWAMLFLALAGAAVSIAFPGHMVAERLWNDVAISDYKESNMEDLWSLAVFLPSLAITARRLHDIGRSATSIWWLLLPIAGAIMMLVWVLKPGQLEANEYGEPVA
jgi:uncharacterized membrane protein YhaH (DUF805 family)